MFVCLRAKWEFGTCVLTAGTEAPTHVKLYKDDTRTVGSGEVQFLCVYAFVCVCVFLCALEDEGHFWISLKGSLTFSLRVWGFGMCFSQF